jgi:hypothetical protein
MDSNGMIMGPAPHPPLMNNLNHLVYVGSGCGNPGTSITAPWYCLQSNCAPGPSNLAKISNLSQIVWW